MNDLTRIRNFSIIAHIDHGKSTLADRMLEITHTVEKRDLVHAQLLDAMDLEQERGITIKSHPVRMLFTASDGNEYELNLIDTPGHVDFSYEVSRSLAACEGAILVLDATQGVQAQTVANVNLAMRHNLFIIPIINKIDLAAADLPLCYNQLEEILRLALEMRRRVKEQLKKLGGMEFYDVNFSYIDNETFEEHFVSVPEQGGGKLIPEGMCSPGQVYTIGRGKSGMIGVFRLESQMLPGSGKCDRTGMCSDMLSQRK